MNQHYTRTQQKIYEDYSLKSSDSLKAILQNRTKYQGHVIDIVTDILHERNLTELGKTEEIELIGENEIIDSADKMFSDSMKAEGQNNMFYGAIIGGIGILVTIVSYSASFNRGSFVIAWGAILFGVIRFIKGFNAYYD